MGSVSVYNDNQNKSAKLVFTGIEDVEIDLANIGEGGSGGGDISLLNEEIIVPDNEELVISGASISGDLFIPNNFAQPGEYRDFAMMNPKGRWLFCDGREINRLDYEDLFNAIGTTYGDGDGKTTFNIPDLRGLFKRSLDFGKNIDYGRELGTFQDYDWKGFYMMNTIQNGSGYNHNEEYHGKSMVFFQGKTFAGKWDSPSAAIGTKWDESEIRPKNISVYTCISY